MKACRGRGIAGVCVLFAGAAQAAGSGSILGKWEAYALGEITPDFTWVNPLDRVAAKPTVLSQFLDQSFADSEGGVFTLDPARGVHIAWMRQNAADTPIFLGDAGISQLASPLPGSSIERTLLAPTISQSLGNDDTTLTGTVILAYQQFASWGMDRAQFGFLPAQRAYGFNEKSYGTGLRLGVAQALGPDWSLHADFQSRVNMDSFQNYRGVYAGAGDFDLPGLVRTGLSWTGSEHWSLQLQASRVFYSDISPFTSRALPVRFLSLLGDGPSPAFAWRDLTAYSLNWEYQISPASTYALNLSTQQQPEPEQRVLRDALSELYTHKNLALTYNHRFKQGAQLKLGASYAAAQSFLGNASYRNRSYTGAQVELEAIWSLAF